MNVIEVKHLMGFMKAKQGSCSITMLTSIFSIHLFFASCIFTESKHSIAFGAGIPILMFILQMLGSAGEKAEYSKANRKRNRGCYPYYSSSDIVDY